MSSESSSMAPRAVTHPSTMHAPRKRPHAFYSKRAILGITLNKKIWFDIVSSIVTVKYIYLLYDVFCLSNKHRFSQRLPLQSSRTHRSSSSSKLRVLIVLFVYRVLPYRGPNQQNSAVSIAIGILLSEYPAVMRNMIKYLAKRCFVSPLWGQTDGPLDGITDGKTEGATRTSEEFLLVLSSNCLAGFTDKPQEQGSIPKQLLESWKYFSGRQEEKTVIKNEGLSDRWSQSKLSCFSRKLYCFRVRLM